MASPSSRWRRRASWCFAHRAVRIATPYSQLPSRSGSRIDRALRARTRKTAWKASSACCTVAQELPADAQHHRPVPGHQRGEGGLAGGVAPRGEPLEELPVGEPRHRAALEERPELPDHRYVPGMPPPHEEQCPLALGAAETRGQLVEDPLKSCHFFECLESPGLPCLERGWKDR